MSDGIARPVTGRELQLVFERERAGDPFVLFRDAVGELRALPLPAQGAGVTIGRRTSNEIALPWDGEVSRVHAALEPIGGEWTISDDGLSRNGTFVNGERLGARRRLVDGDAIHVGASSLVFRNPAGAGGGESSAGTLASSDELTNEDLTPTERRILVALCRPFKYGAGFASPATNQQIAKELFLSVDAVKSHLRSMFQKFGAADLPQNQKRLHLVERALLLGLVKEREL